MDTYEMNSHSKGKNIALITLIVSVVLAILFGFLYIREIGKRPLIKYPTYTLSTNEWTSDNIIITVTNPSEKISEYSFDGGKTYQEDNIYEVVENGNYEIIVKDKNGRLSKSIPFAIRNIDKEPPVISTENTTTIEAGKQFSLKSGVIVTDDGSGVNGAFTVTPNTIDTNKPGTYNITYTAFDKVGNYSEKQRTIVVKEAIQGKVYYRYRTATIENYQCEPYQCNCINSKTASETGTCPTGYTYKEPGQCCNTCYKTCKKTNWGEWSRWSETKVNPSATVEVETKVE